MGIRDGFLALMSQACSIEGPPGIKLLTSDAVGPSMQRGKVQAWVFRVFRLTQGTFRWSWLTKGRQRVEECLEWRVQPKIFCHMQRIIYPGWNYPVDFWLVFLVGVFGCCESVLVPCYCKFYYKLPALSWAWTMFMIILMGRKAFDCVSWFPKDRMSSVSACVWVLFFTRPRRWCDCRQDTSFIPILQVYFPVPILRP